MSLPPHDHPRLAFSFRWPYGLLVILSRNTLSRPSSFDVHQRSAATCRSVAKDVEALEKTVEGDFKTCWFVVGGFGIGKRVEKVRRDPRDG